MNSKKGSDGRFMRTQEFWTPENWDAGYTDNKGRHRVYRPDYPRAYKEGYCLRAHVVWWLNTGEICPHGIEIHHKDGSRDNDCFENLIALTNSEHQIIHRRKLVTITCQVCGKEFSEKLWRVLGRGRKYCSNECYQKHPRSAESRKKQSDSLKKAYMEGRR
jgi:hypothetical protein